MNDYNIQQKKPASNLATASLVLGICSVFSILFGLAPVFGGIGIILALLSRGDQKMHNYARVGLFLSIGGSVVCILAIFSVLFFLFQSTDFKTQLEKRIVDYSDQYAEDFSDDDFEEYFGDYFNDYFDDYFDDDYNEAPNMFGEDMI